MPRYHFSVRFSDYLDEDEEGTWLPHDRAARDYASRIVAQLKEGGGYDDPEITMIVADGSGREVFVLPFSKL